jgi:cytoskeleton protein RodZ
MQSVGQQIREQRLRLGLKLEEISARSRISMKMLHAIENDELAGISSPFLYKSFVRQFAEHIKLDYKTLAAAVDSGAASMPQPRMPGEQDLGRTNVAPLPVRHRSRNFRWLYSAASLPLVLVACSSLYGLWQNSKSSSWRAELKGFWHAGSENNAPKATVAAPAVVEESSPSDGASPAAHRAERPAARSPKSTPAENNTLASREADSDAPAPAVVEQNLPELRVELSATERTWLSIIEDGKQTFSGVLDPEETKVIEGDDTARIRTGNAGGISCVFNGKSIGPLGPRGQVRTVVFTKSNYEVLEAPTPIAMARYPTILQ